MGGAAPGATGPAPAWHDWGEAPAAPVLRDRAEELATLAGWVRQDGCRVVELVGAGGIGKTALAARLAHDLAPVSAVIHWRSLRNAPPTEEWLAGAISALSAARALPLAEPLLDRLSGGLGNAEAVERRLLALLGPGEAWRSRSRATGRGTG